MPIPAGPSPELPAWAPTQERVAAYIPRRAIVGTTTGYGEPNTTFTTESWPRAAAVNELILAACNWILTATGVLVTAYESPAADLAARHAAGWIAMGNADTAEETAHGRYLLEQCDKDLVRLADANIGATDTQDDPTTLADNVLPVWSFPAATEQPL